MDSIVSTPSKGVSTVLTVTRSTYAGSGPLEYETVMIRRQVDSLGSHL